MVAKKVKTKAFDSVADSIREKIEGKIGTIISDALKFDEGNNAAGTRVRTGLQDVKIGIKEVRDLVQEIKESRK